MRRKIILKGVLILVISLFMVSSTVFAQENWSSIKANGIPYETPEGVFVDKSNTPWITGPQSGEGGIYYFPENDNGIWYTNENTNANLPEEYNINSFMEDDNGNQWFSTWGDGLICKKANGQWIKFDSSTHFILDFENTEYVYRVKEANDDGYWMITYGGVYKINSDLTLDSTTYYIYTDTSIADFIQDSNGNLWLATGAGVNTDIGGNGYLESLDDVFNDENAPPSDYTTVIHSIYEDSLGNIWFISNTYGSGGIYKYTTDGDWIYYDDSVSGIPTNSITSIIESPITGDIWFGTNYRGLIKYSDGVFTNYTKDDLGLDSGDIYSIDVDGNGSLWFVTGSEAGIGMGVNKMTFNGGAFNITSYNYKNTSTSLTSNRIWDVAVDNSGGVWFGSNGDGLAYMDPDGNWQQFHSYMDNSYLGNEYVSGIDVDSENRVYFQFWGGGYSIYDVDNGTWEALDSPYKMDCAYDVYIDPDDGKWFCHYNGLLYLNSDNDEWILYDNSNTGGGIPDDIVNCAFKDSRNNIWVGTRGGLGRLNDDGSWDTYVYDYSSDNSFQLIDVESITESENGTIYAQGSSAVQAYDYDTDSWMTMMPNDDIPYASYIKKMPNGDIWFGTGILRTDGSFERYDMDNTDKAIPYGGETSVKDIAYDSNGNVYFAFINSGVTVYSGEDFSQSTEPVPDNSKYVLWSENNSTENVDQTKQWMISFNKDLDESTITENNIFVYNKNQSQYFNITLELLNGNKIRVTPDTPYASGEEYTLYISKDVKASYGEALVNGIRMDFNVK